MCTPPLAWQNLRWNNEGEEGITTQTSSLWLRERLGFPLLWKRTDDELINTVRRDTYFAMNLISKYRRQAQSDYLLPRFGRQSRSVSRAPRCLKSCGISHRRYHASDVVFDGCAACGYP